LTIITYGKKVEIGDLTVPRSERKTALQTNPETELCMPLVGQREKVRQLRLTNPHWSLGDIAQETGISRERVRQLLDAEGLPTRRETPRAVIDRVLESMPEPVPSATPKADNDNQPESKKKESGETLPVTRRSPFEGSEGERDV
jgi:hypothetical protein